MTFAELVSIHFKQYFDKPISHLRQSCCHGPSACMQQDKI